MLAATRLFLALPPSLWLLHQLRRRRQIQEPCRFLPPLGTVRLGCLGEDGEAAAVSSFGLLCSSTSAPLRPCVLRRGREVGGSLYRRWAAVAACGVVRGGFQTPFVLELGWWFAGEGIRWPSPAGKGISDWSSPGLGPGRRSPTPWRLRSRRRTVWSVKAARSARYFSSSRMVAPAFVAATAETSGAAGFLRGLQGCVCNFSLLGVLPVSFQLRCSSGCFACVCAWLVLCLIALI